MPEPVSDSQRYLPGLDGLRALAVGAVVAYHMDLGWAQGGLLGVGVFFTLSGYLITDLLLGQYERTGGLQLVDFWLRRARRLLPALFVMLTVVVAWVTLLDRSLLSEVRGAVGASAVYVTNWWLIAQHSSYFAQFAPPSPLGHLWSLAVEEQFYLIWPWLLWIGLRWKGTGAGSYKRLAAASLLLAVASAVAMALLYRPGYDTTRVYDGTDTRACALLIGAALAFVWPSRHLLIRADRRARWALDGAGFAGLTVFAVLVWRTSEYSAFLYRGGLVLLSFATALMVAAAASPASWFGRILGGESLRWVGVRSYGIYLWHFPIIVLTTPAGGGDTPSRRVLQLAAIIGCAAVSWRYVEEPIRRGGLSKWWAQIRRNGWRLGALGRQPRIAVAASMPVLVLASCGISGVVQPGSAFPALVIQPAAGLAAASPQPQRIAAASPQPQRIATASPQPEHTAASAAASTPRAAAADPDRTSCRSVVHIGDSTSDGLISPEYLPDPRDRIDARYAQVGVTTFIPEISGARSIVETYQGYPNAYTVARQLIQQGYHGCWVLALGTNDTADVAVGSPVGLAARIKEMMSLIGNQPVMWVNVRSLLSYGPYSENNMLAWDEALLQACASYPNMRVYDWAAAVQDGWFISDGIHFTSAGYAARAYLIARALAAAFPEQGGAGQLASCLVR
jgi:peptidoglycan/LPS O-acetylase OafA/YrhL/lysophospholipase L1-like esterase